MENASFIMSIVSIILSSVLTTIKIIDSKKSNIASLESVYFNYLFQDLILIKLPSAKLKIRIDENNKLVDTEDMLKVLKEIRHNSIYYQSADKKFYKKLKDALQGLEDFILLSEDKDFPGDDKERFYIELKGKSEKIYRVMLDKYSGKTNRIHK